MSDPLIGARIDARYLIEGVHGVGGMSVVYAGVHQDLRRRVAIKVLDGAWAQDPEVVERFLIEARTASALTHPNIVPVSDLGRLPDGRPYLVMPMIEGHDLATLLAQEGPQPPRRVATLLWGAALALDLIHRKGLVHRDIKSENLMYVSNDDGSETVLVLDFGIAGALGLPNMDNASGTPEFMPPEALNGALPDHRADVYALATVAFELLTGVLPYDSGDLQDLIAKKSSEAPRRMSDVGLTRFPEPLEAVVARGLSRRAQERHNSASAFMREFEAAAAIASPPEPISEVSPIPPARSALRESRTLLGTGIPFYPSRTPAPSATPTPTGVRSRAETRIGTGPQAPITSEEEAQRLLESERAKSVQGDGEGQRDTPSMPHIVVSQAASAKAASVRAASAKAASAKVSRILRTTRGPHMAARNDGDPMPLASAVLSPRTQPAPSITAKVGEAPPPAGADPFAATQRLPAMPRTAPAPEGEAPREETMPPARVENVWRYSDDSLQPTSLLDEDEMEGFEGARRPSRAPLYVGLSVVAAIGIALAARSYSPPGPTSTASTSSVEAVSAPASAPATALQPAAPSPEPAALPALETPPSPEPAAAPSAPVAAPMPAAAVPVTAAPEPTAAEPEESPRKSRRSESRSARGASRTTAAPARAPRAAAPPQPRLTITPAPEPPPAPRALAPKVAAGAESSEELTKSGTDAMLRGDLATAAQKFNQAIAANPSDASAHRGKALVLERQGKTREAAAAFREFLRLRPTGPASDKIRQRLEELEGN